MMGIRELSKTYQKGLEFYDQGLLIDALGAFETVFKGAEPESPEARLAGFYIGETHARLAEESLHRGARQRAEEHLRAAIARNPKYPDLHYHLAEIMLEGGAIHEAMLELQVALKLNPDYAKALLKLGILSYEIGEYQSGAGQIARAVALEPRYGIETYRDALTAHGRADHRLALTFFHEMALTNVDDISFHFGVGKMLYRSGDFRRAVEAFEQALSVKGSYADIRNWLGLSLMACREHERALEQFQRALEINPNFTSAIINAGIACEMMKLAEDAAAFYKRALETAPDNIEACERLARLQPVANGR